jgi:FkbM family methyltransferase
MNINFTKLTEQVKPRGVIHVGANTCQELPLYLSHGIENRIWVEPIKQLDFPKGEKVINIAISDKVIENDFMYLANNNGESSSLLKPLKHIDLYQEINFSQSFVVTDVTTLGRILENPSLFPAKYNYLVLDIQGAELKALNGLGFYQSHFDVIITEAYTQELYENCGKLHEIEAFLSNYKLVEFAPEIGKGWGDAAFIRKDLI